MLMLFLYHCVGLLDLAFFDLHQEEVGWINFLHGRFILLQCFQDDGISFSVVVVMRRLINSIQKVHKQPLLELAPIGLGKFGKADTCTTKSVSPDHQAAGVDICLGIGKIQNQVQSAVWRDWRRGVNAHARFAEVQDFGEIENRPPGDPIEGGVGRSMRFLTYTTAPLAALRQFLERRDALLESHTQGPNILLRSGD